MASSNLGKRCYQCDIYKKHEDFIRPSGNSTNEYATFNTCVEIKREKDLRLLVNQQIQEPTVLKILKFDDDFVNIPSENQEVDKEIIYRNIAESLLMLY
ncbi:hypothetical protein C2G38_2189514 [Gigaspora rosea]|uniref:Uncharacterized protein n=1 Tax=Gigaspora rosea TaxID=44941 RepID=A0A397V3V7_9GLOM|nr:hypothetical protein C2G38_2189514 [Gigaspora rosea]